MVPAGNMKQRVINFLRKVPMSLRKQELRVKEKVGFDE